MRSHSTSVFHFFWKDLGPIWPRVEHTQPVLSSFSAFLRFQPYTGETRGISSPLLPLRKRSPTFLRGFEPPRIRRLYESINSSSLSTQPLESNDASFIYHKLLYAVSPTGAVLEAYSWTIDLRAEAIID